MEALLTPIESVVSGRVAVQPILMLSDEAAEQLRKGILPELQAKGVELHQDRFLFYPLSIGAEWRVTVGEQTTQTESDGRFFLRQPLTATEGRVTHPTDDRTSFTFPVSGLSRGQQVRSQVTLPTVFRGGCGMSNPEEFCGPVLDVSSSLAMQAGPPSVLARDFITNDAGKTVPNPTEIQTLNRGSYPQPLDALQREVECHQGCAQTNGSIPKDLLNLNYLGSTCEDFVVVGACPNENTLSDSQFAVTGLFSLPFLFADRVLTAGEGTEVLLSSPFGIPTGVLTCMDNHKGRVCQQCLIGDISLDFTFSGKGPLVKPKGDTPTIKVRPGATIDFVLHNNGNFGVTEVIEKELKLRGRLERTFEELPSTTRPIGTTRQTRFVSSAPILGLTPNFGQLQPPPSTGPVKVAFASRLFRRPLGKIEHFYNTGVLGSLQACRQYRYYPDLVLRYTAPEDGAEDAIDHFVFESEGSQIAVIFELDRSTPTPSPTPIVEPTSSPSPTPTGTPANLIAVNGTQRLIAGAASPCPLSLAAPLEIINLSSSQRVHITYRKQATVEGLLDILEFDPPLSATVEGGTFKTHDISVGCPLPSVSGYLYYTIEATTEGGEFFDIEFVQFEIGIE